MFLVRCPHHNNTQEELLILDNFLGYEVEASKGRPIGEQSNQQWQLQKSSEQ